MDRFTVLACAVFGASLIGCSSQTATTSDDRALSVFAQKVQRQIDCATDPTAVDENQINTDELARCVSTLESRRRALQARLEDKPADLESTNVSMTRERIELIRVERQLRMIDRLLLRYEQNAPAMASGN